MALYEFERSELQLKDGLKQFKTVKVNVDRSDGKEIFTISAFDKYKNEYRYCTYRKQHIKVFKTMNYVWEEIKEVFPNVTKIFIDTIHI